MEREREMYRLRTEEGLTLREIGRWFGVGPERVRQILRLYLYKTTNQPVDSKVLSRAAAATRREKDLAHAHAQAEGLLAAWRQGRSQEEIAKGFGLRCRSVAQVIRAEATIADRAPRDYARTPARGETGQTKR